jgi:hypothetical protein
VRRFLTILSRDFELLKLFYCKFDGDFRRNYSVLGEYVDCNRR